ncbi:hypothetical protein ACF8GG_16440 [Pseudomonas sp. yb_1]|uniref:hypothetical protein n=1 Tax=Pseudomonas sp. yb_1 TaxID=3367217 RepID=UPI00370C71B1
MSKPNGGPAFPVPGLQEDESFNGMTLRDYFAAKAMHGTLAAMDSGERNYTPPETIAKNAYALADAMLAARVKP